MADASLSLLVPSSNDSIFVKDLVIGYGSTKVIEGLHMQVPAGSIYGLLGPSGCGKSTLLKILLGRLVPEAGEVLVFGRAPGSRGHRVPGSAVGYAPQEAALYLDITIAETFEFHAKLQGMTKDKLESRKKWLSSFLDLPPMNRIVGQLSGGQSRRLSLAVALLHDPQLLILDEPTVGVDPLLRSRIWQHLTDVANSGVTVIVTTHYIEEARQAHCVGLMRNGRLLDEGPPMDLIRKYNLSTLEDVFLTLCRNEEGAILPNDIKMPLETQLLLSPDSPQLQINQLHDNDQTNQDQANQNQHQSNKNQFNRTRTDTNEHTYYHEEEEDSSPHSTTLLASFLAGLAHCLAIAQRKAKQIIRNKKLLAYTLLTPAFQIFLFFIAIGPDPRNLNFAVVNLDRGLGSVNLGASVVKNLASGGDIFSLHTYNDLDYSINQIKQGKEWGVMYIPTNFTADLVQKTMSPTPDPVIQYQSTVHLYLDMSNYQITLLIQQKVLAAFEGMVSATLNVSVSPVQIDEAVYGNANIQFKNFLAPGMIALVCFAHSIGITAVSFVREKNDGTMDRIYAAGVTSKIIIIGHFFVSNAILLTQTATLLLLVIFGFKVTIEGNIIWVIVFLLALGAVGMSLGLVISGAATIETEAVQLSLSAYFPALLMSGVLWPVEAIPSWLGWAAYALPTTWAADALRSVIIRGWGMTHKGVWTALLIVLAWAVALMAAAVLILNAHQFKLCCNNRKKDKHVK